MKKFSLLFLIIGVCAILFAYYWHSPSRASVSSHTMSDTFDYATATDAEIESHCKDLKEAHIIHCGRSLPENDFDCRTKEAEEIYRQCMAFIKN